jgi:molybdate transport system substrate-binding protein
VLVRNRALWTAALALALCSLAGGARADEVKVLSAGAMKAIVTEVAEAFRRDTGHSVAVEFDTVGALRKRAAAEPADVLILTDAAVDDLAREGVAAAGTRVDIARVGMGVAVKAGAPAPDISTTAAFRQAILDARSIVYVDPARGGTSGIHFASVLERLGIADAVKAKSVLWPGGYAAEAIVKGQADLCVHQISEIIPVAGVTLVGPLPKELQKVTVYSGALGARAASPEAARAFLAYLSRPALKPRLAAAGLDYRD